MLSTASCMILAVSEVSLLQASTLETQALMRVFVI